MPTRFLGMFVLEKKRMRKLEYDWEELDWQERRSLGQSSGYPFDERSYAVRPLRQTESSLQFKA